VAARSKAHTFLDSSSSGIVGSNPTRGMDICTICYVLCSLVTVEALQWTDPPSKESYQNVYKRFHIVKSNSESKQARGPNVWNEQQ